MRRDRARTVAGVAAAFLFAVALAGCGRHGLAPTAMPVGTGASSEISVDNSLNPGGGSSRTDLSSVDPGAGQTGKPTMDPVASELDQINQLINDIDNSVNSSDSGGGE